jgi:hypothetical protein
VIRDEHDFKEEALRSWRFKYRYRGRTPPSYGAVVDESSPDIGLGAVNILAVVLIVIGIALLITGLQTKR